MYWHFRRQVEFYSAGLLLCATLFPLPLLAAGYGIYEARGLAMGGTTVALSSTDNAIFYNPALLSFHDGDEDKLRDGHIMFPVFSLQASRAIEDAIGLDDDNLSDELTASIDAFNASQNADTAQAVVDSSADLLDAIDALDNEDLIADGFFGLSISEPGDREGAGFYFGGRVLGGGKADVTDSDQVLLEDYVEALDFIASNGERGEAHPELFSGGQLIDPVESLNSSARVKGVGIIEAGVALSKEYDLWGVPVAMGITPKWMRVRTYEAFQDVQGGDIDSDSSEQDFYTGNADIGVAMEWADYYRFGLAVKDVVTKHFETELGNDVTLGAKPRAGFAYVTEQLQLGVDLDLDRVEAIGEESAVQELSLGGEWRSSRRFAWRAGYRHDLSGNRDDIASLGVGMMFGGFLMDVAVAHGQDTYGIALQMGFRR